jgi:hypothetical protein
MFSDQQAIDLVKEMYDLEAEIGLEVDKIKSNPYPDRLAQQRLGVLNQTLDEINANRLRMFENNLGLHDAFVQKYRTPQGPPQEGPGWLDQTWKGVKEAVKYPIQHPMAALQDAAVGAHGFVSAPLRALESVLVPGGRLPDKYSVKKAQEDVEGGIGKGHQAEGIDPHGTGPAVARSVGAMAVPLPFVPKATPKMWSGETLKNALKGGALGGGTYAVERIADDQPVDDAGLLTSGAIGAGLSALLGRYAGRGQGAKAAPAPDGPTPTPDPTTPPNAGGTRDNIDASHMRVYTDPPVPDATGQMLPSPAKLLEHKSAMTPPPPPKGLPPPEPRTPSPVAEMMNRIREKTDLGEPLTSQEQRFVLWAQKRMKNIPPPNAAGTREVIDVTPTPQKPAPPPTAKAAPPAVAEAAPPPARPTALETLLKKEKPAGVAPVAEAARGIEAEKAARLAAGKTADNKLVEATKVLPDAERQARIKAKLLANNALANKPVEVPPADKPIPPKDLIAVTNKVGEELEKASNEALLAKVLKEEVDVKNVPMTPKAKKTRGTPPPPKSEAPAPAVKGEVGELGVQQPVAPAARSRKVAQSKPTAEQIYQEALAKGKTPAQAKDLAEFKADQKLNLPQKEMKLEEYLSKEGYRVEQKEPFPGQTAYHVIDPKTGNRVASGDRDAILNAMNAKNEGKGIKLTSGVDPSDVVDMIKKKLGIMPEGVEVTKSPHREGVVNMALRDTGLETPQFAMRKTKTGRAAVDAVLDAEDLAKTRVNSLFHEPQADGTFKDTKAFEYFAAQPGQRVQVNKILVLEDKLGEEFTPAQLIKNGLSEKEVSMHQGVREMLNKVKGWLKEISEDFESLIKGYIPRTWAGNLELFVNGEKHLKPNGSSSFATLREAAEEMWKIKKTNPTAAIEARFFTDPDYLLPRGLADARAVAKAKKNIEDIGKLSAKEIEEAFSISKGYKDFARHLMERRDAKGYDTEDLERILFSYVNQAAKTIENRRMRDAVAKIIKESSGDLSASQVKYLEGYMDRVAGKPSWDQAWVDTMLRSTPISKWIDPVSIGAGIKTARDWITFKSLGFGNVSWALVNLDSLTRHVWPMLQQASGGKMGKFAAEKYGLAAIHEFYTNKLLRQKLAHNQVIDIQMMSEYAPALGAHFGKAQLTPQKIIMYLGTTTEEFVRGVAAIARYRMALAQGASDSDAMRIASRFVAETVGRYSKAGKPPAFTGLVGGTVGMFKTYPVVMLQNMFKAFESKDPGVIVRYMLASLGAGGAIGALPGSEEIDTLATKYLGFSPIQWGYEHLGEGIMTGLTSTLPSPVAMDFSRKAGLPDVFPNDTKDWLGPMWNTYAQAIIDASQGEYKEAMKDLIPTSLRNILAVSQKPGMVVGRYDKPSVELAPGKTARVMRGLGFQSPEEVRAMRDYQYLETRRAANEQRLSQLSRLLYQNKATSEEAEEYRRLGGTNRRIHEEARRETLTTRQRQERNLPRVLRHQAPASE